MIEIVGIFRTHTVKRIFDNVWDAIEYRDYLDAQYARVKWVSL